MKHALSLEMIGDNYVQLNRLDIAKLDNLLWPGAGAEMVGKISHSCWVAEITGRHERYVFERRFLPYHKDYSGANRIGSRGIMARYTVEDGRIYEVSSPTSWARVDRYFCRYEGGLQIRMTKEEVVAWLER